jgi:hypothetical protein
MRKTRALLALLSEIVFYRQFVSSMQRTRRKPFPSHLELLRSLYRKTENRLFKFRSTEGLTLGANFH